MTNELPPSTGSVPLSTIAWVWSRIGVTGFGGPPAHIALLRRPCVDEREWITTRDRRSLSAWALGHLWQLGILGLGLLWFVALGRSVDIRRIGAGVLDVIAGVVGAPVAH